MGPTAHSPPAWRLGPAVVPNWKFQTGWGRNLSLERREFASSMRMQSHRCASRTEVAAGVCALLVINQKILLNAVCPPRCIGGAVRALLATIEWRSAPHAGNVWMGNALT